MLTTKQRDLLLFIHERITDTGVSPSFDEMKDALNLASKSGIHRLIKALEERGFVERLPNRARALQVKKLPEAAAPKAPPRGRQAFKPTVVGGLATQRPPQQGTVPVLGRIAAGVPVEAIQQEVMRINAPADLPEGPEYFALEVQGDSMIDAGIFEKDHVILRRTDTASNNEIVVALIDGQEATLKRFRKRGGSVALEAANRAFETRIFGPERVQIQGRLVALVRRYP